MIIFIYFFFLNFHILIYYNNECRKKKINNITLKGGSVIRITRLLLKNFIGIKHGLNLDEIELDFSKSNDRIIMLLGSNGSGKSTIMSALQVFRQSFDDRKDLILDGKEGRKEIDIESNGHKYEIVHIYAKTAQSFIKKDGIELNENGGVRTFEDIVEKQLGITKDYFNIGKIGSNTRSFVDFTASERKNYIGNFLNIEDMLDKHKVAADKLKALKKDIATVANELGKHQDESVIKTEIEQLSKSNEEIDKELNEQYQQQGALTTEIQRDTDDIGSSSIDDLSNKIKEKTNDSETNKNIKAQLEQELEHTDNPDEYSKILSEEISDIQAKIQVNDNEKSNKILLTTDCQNKISSLEIELKSLGNPEDIERLKNEIEELQEKAETLRNAIKNNPEGQLVNKELSGKKDVMRFISKFTDFTDFIEKYFTDLSATSITNTKSNIEYFFDDDFEISFRRQIQESKTAIENKQLLLESQQKDRGIKESYVCQLENLKKRPTNCNIDDCPFIKAAYEHRNVLTEIVEKDEEIKQTKKDLETLNTKSENLQYIQNLYLNFKKELESVAPRENAFYIEFVKEKSLAQWVNSSLSEFQKTRQEIIENVTNAVSDINDYLTALNKIKADEASKKILEDSGSTVREKYEKDIEEMKEKKLKFDSELTVLIETGKSLSDQLLSKQNLLNKYTTFIQAASKYASAQTMLSTAKSEYERISKLVDNKTQSSLKLSKVMARINELQIMKNDKNNKLSSLNSELVRVQELNEKKTNLNSLYIPVSTIEEALSPTKGIPLILMQTYLDETEAIANELLNIAFNGDFQIKFITTEKEFSIQVESKGNLKSDIKMASQGEIAITTISLSLALIEQSIGDYNILCLDEIDGPLDPTNRGNFINILNSQIEKLGIEQVFVISHNNAFDTAEMGLVLLRGNNIDKDNSVFMENKTIIYEYKEI